MSNSCSLAMRSHPFHFFFYVYISEIVLKEKRNGHRFSRSSFYIFLEALGELIFEESTDNLYNQVNKLRIQKCIYNTGQNRQKDIKN